MENNKVHITVECEECKHNFAIGPEGAPNLISNKKEYEVKGQSIFLTYYDCPSCGRRHFVQIDDAESLRMLNETKRMFVDLAKKKKKGKEISKKQLAKFDKTRKDLSKRRTELMKQFANEEIFDEVKEDYIKLRFSI